MRSILHVDLDAFFASVEQRDNPSLRGQPVVVGGDGGRGVVAAASYEARRFGVHSAMPMVSALRACPHAVVVPHRMEAYSEASHAFFSILDDFSPLVEGLSIDEAFLDLTGSERLMGAPIEIARQIKARVLSDIELVASVGIAPSKFVAKIASDIRKPDGLFVVTEQEVLPFLHALPVSRLWGVGRVTQEKLASMGLRYIGDIANYPQRVLEKKLGKSLGAHLSCLAMGQDSREVKTGRSAVSVGHDETFAKDTADREVIQVTFRRQADKIARRLRKRNLRARTLTIKIKYSDFRQITRQAALPDPSSDAQSFYECALRLLSQVSISGGQQVRLCGISVSNLRDQDAPRQLGFEEKGREKRERLDKTMDTILDRFGDVALMRASHAPKKPKHD